MKVVMMPAYSCGDCWTALVGTPDPDERKLSDVETAEMYCPNRACAQYRNVIRFPLQSIPAEEVGPLPGKP